MRVVPRPPREVDEYIRPFTTLERWQPEAFVDPTKPASEPALQLGIDSAGLEVTPTTPPTLEELKRQETKPRGRRVGIGVGVSVALVLVAVVVAAVAVPASISRSFD
jgi:hypothetical protein